MNPQQLFSSFAERVIRGEALGQFEARQILNSAPEDIFHLLAASNEVRRHFKGDAVNFCAVISAKSGACPEDCAFCAQSAHHAANAPVYPLMHPEKILEHARAAQAMGANKVGIVTSGPGIDNEQEMSMLCDALSGVARETGVDRCASLGSLDSGQLARLKAAGLQSVHHNIETAESFFKNICSTHTYRDRVEMVRRAREAGFYVCSGGIFGMGETSEHRIEMALALRGLDVDSIPLNFLNPIPGTRLESAQPLHPLEILKIIAMFRFLLPEKDIRICGGREKNLRSLQPLMYAAGANCTMLGNYLTTQGRNYLEDIEMISDLGLHRFTGREE